MFVVAGLYVLGDNGNDYLHVDSQFIKHKIKVSKESINEL